MSLPDFKANALYYTFVTSSRLSCSIANARSGIARVSDLEDGKRRRKLVSIGEAKKMPYFNNGFGFQLQAWYISPSAYLVYVVHFHSFASLLTKNSTTDIATFSSFIVCAIMIFSSWCKKPRNSVEQKGSVRGVIREFSLSSEVVSDSADRKKAPRFSLSNGGGKLISAAAEAASLPPELRRLDRGTVALHCTSNRSQLDRFSTTIRRQAFDSSIQDTCLGGTFLYQPLTLKGVLDRKCTCHLSP